MSASLPKVAVIGPSLAEKLFGNLKPLGKQISISQRRFEVVGISEKYGSMLGIDIDNAIYIPITTAQKVIGFDNLMQIMIKVKKQRSNYSNSKFSQKLFSTKTDQG